MLDDALFLRVIGVHIRNSKRLGVRVDLDADYAIRLLEMAERASPRQATPTPELRARLDADHRR